MRHRRSAGLARRAAALATGGALCALGFVVLAPAAGAVAAKTHDPVGAITAVKAVAGGVQVTGWTADPDSPKTNLALVVELDGTKTLATSRTSVANKSIAAKHHTGPTPGYVLTVKVPTGKHTLCVLGANIGSGISTAVGCVELPVGTKLTSSQLAKRSPVGAVTGYSASSSTVRFRGWSSDPDWLYGRLRVVLYVDDNPAATVYTTGHPTPLPKGAGSRSGFDITVKASKGTHIGCIWVVNMGWGSNSYLGCHAVDTRGAAGKGALPKPAANKTVVAEALKHRGQSYVWGATGPKKFDCSGLVLYSYSKAKMTLPRVSEAQALAARLIPASRAVPGDLVFTHDSEGDVYHVGIYIKPGQAFAAIDTAEGVNYQNIWDPADTTYGSFTHT